MQARISRVLADLLMRFGFRSTFPPHSDESKSGLGISFDSRISGVADGANHELRVAEELLGSSHRAAKTRGSRRGAPESRRKPALTPGGSRGGRRRV